MTTREGGWGMVGFSVLFGGLACVFAFVPLMVLYVTLMSLLVDREELFRQLMPRIGTALGAYALMLSAAIACGYTCIRRLDGRPVRWWALFSLSMAGATILATGMYSPTFWFPGI